MMGEGSTSPVPRVAGRHRLSIIAQLADWMDVQHFMPTL
jgi:hypothetical protein